MGASLRSERLLWGTVVDVCWILFFCFLFMFSIFFVFCFLFSVFCFFFSVFFVGGDGEREGEGGVDSPSPKSCSFQILRLDLCLNRALFKIFVTLKELIPGHHVVSVPQFRKRSVSC